MARLKSTPGLRPVSNFERRLGLPVSLRSRAAFFSRRMGAYVSFKAKKDDIVNTALLWILLVLSRKDSQV